MSNVRNSPTEDIWEAAKAGPIALAREAGWALMTTNVGTRWFITYLHLKSIDHLVKGEGVSRGTALFHAACAAMGATAEQAMLKSQIAKILREGHL
jgi:hypothetical protein